MFKLAIHHPRQAGAPREVELVDGELVIGRSVTVDVVLESPIVAPHHARVVTRGSSIVIVDLGSANGTFVNHVRLAAPCALVPGDRVVIGDHALDLHDADVPVRTFAPRDPVEAELLARVAAGDLASRAIYADWLDERGLAREAAFVRVQDRVAGERVPPLDAVRSAARFPYAWRVLVARPRIEACSARSRGACPDDWGALAGGAVDEPDVRRCQLCARSVHYCETIVAARHHVAGGEPVALDLREPRWDFDLARFGPACTACGYRGSDAFARDCLRCGSRLPAQRLLLG